MRAYEFITEYGTKKLDDDLIDLVKLLWDEGKTQAEIGQYLSMKPANVHTLLARYYPDRPRVIARPGRELSASARTEIVNDFVQGLSVKEIGRKYGVSNNLIVHELETHLGNEYQNEIARRRAVPGQMVSNKISAENLAKMIDMYRQGMGPKDIAIHFDNIAHPTSILRAIRRQPNYAELRKEWEKRRSDVRPSVAATRQVYRPGTIGNLRSKGPGSPSAYGMFSKNRPV